jgi:hypothetical protein
LVPSAELPAEALGVVPLVPVVGGSVVGIVVTVVVG